MGFCLILLCHGAYADDPPPVGQSKSEPSAVPEGQSKINPVLEEEGIGADIFGKQGGNFHPFLIFQEVYTDNLFATHSNTKNDYSVYRSWCCCYLH